MNKNFVNLIFSVALLSPAFAQEKPLKAFPLSAVRLTESPFYNAQQTDMAYILAMDPDRLLAPYLRESGLKPLAASYGNWENTGLDGHIGGHYISALADMYASTGDKEILRRLNYMVDWLDKCQQQNGDGYVSGVPGGRAMWKDIAAGKIKAASFSLNDKWVPWYNIHKTYAGLKDAYLIGGNEKARGMLLKLSDWCLNLVSGLSDTQIQDMLRSEHGGMNEIFADVYEFTGDKKYLTLARRFSDMAILTPLLNKQDKLNGMHANTQIPKVIGYMRVAQVAGDDSWRDASRFFWETVVNNRTVSIGGNSVSEHFNPSGDFSSMIESKEGPETCNTYNMLKLSKELFLNDRSGKYLDFYERALYNHILSSQHPDKGGFVYFTSMRPNHYRVYSEPQEGFWCCVGSGLENHAKYGDVIYAHDDQSLFVNLFIPSTLNWKERKLSLTQRTKFPYEEQTEILVKVARPQEFALKIRVPKWVQGGSMKVLVNNKAVDVQHQESGYVSVKRRWKTGDVVNVHLPMETRAEQLPDGSPWVSFVHGPVVLAAATQTADLPGLRADGSRMGHVANGPLYPLDEAPFVVSNLASAAGALKPVDGKPLYFTASDIISDEKYRNLQLKPFHEVHDARYIVYWPIASPDALGEMKATLKGSEARKMETDKRTVDRINPGQQQPESDHGFKSENSEMGIQSNRHFRNATGWFSYDLKNPAKDARSLRLTYYGKDTNRAFDIYLNDVKLASETFGGEKGDRFFDVDYEIPEAVIRQGKDKLTLRFEAKSGSRTADIYFVRLLR
ncbi:hypothetical protein B0I27_104162 [Arcticibacter pallidicorallinus]|uniref:Uncharacterized protein n=1 Tax=Arcticibacter pallidicorallinus TaxID=1259464 RepID=A0A2T0U5F2_9SPHI|nr:glycoside hydrolase family 127 protein [Arcticibacter pallidicorallinus]PRY53153.1 hypothetical protein B0I27_104162 [Arcticibacter pallidicorallinus]